MAYLIDTSILARLANTADPQYPMAVLRGDGVASAAEKRCAAPQNLVEFRNAATRPVAQNGLGLTAAEAMTKASLFEAAFPLLVETPDIYPAWKALVDSMGVIGKQVHDARLVACCHIHGISHLLSFNTAHFVRLAASGPGIMAVDPATI